jgi:hypothetical protein
MKKDILPYFALDLKRESVQVCVSVEGIKFFVTNEGIVKKGSTPLEEEEIGKIQWMIEGMQDPEMLQFWNSHQSKTIVDKQR